MSSSPNHPHVAGLILARGGSQAIPLKNIASLGGKPLLSWALEAIINMQEVTLDSIWVSTDHPAIAEVASRHGPKVKVFWRSPLYATAEAPSISAVAEFLENRSEVDIVALIQCTSPLIQPRFLTRAYQTMMSGDFDSVFGVTRTKQFRWKESSQSNPTTQALNFDPANRTRRQDWPGELVENGMFYFTRRHLIEKGLFQGGKCTYVEVPKQYSLEIDSKVDLACAESVLALAQQ